MATDCRECGALVVKLDEHEAWHVLLRGAMAELRELVSPSQLADRRSAEKASAALADRVDEAAKLRIQVGELSEKVQQVTAVKLDLEARISWAETLISRHMGAHYSPGWTKGAHGDFVESVLCALQGKDSPIESEPPAAIERCLTRSPGPLGALIQGCQLTKGHDGPHRNTTTDGVVRTWSSHEWAEGSV